MFFWQTLGRECIEYISKTKARKTVKNKTIKATIDSINYIVCSLWIKSIYWKPWRYSSNSLYWAKLTWFLRLILSKKRVSSCKATFSWGLHFYSFRIRFRPSLELLSHDLIFVNTNFIPIVSAIKLQEVESLG